MRTVAALRQEGWKRADVDALARPTDMVGVRIVQVCDQLPFRQARIIEALEVAPPGGVLCGWAAATWHGVPEGFLNGTSDGTRRLPVDFCVPREVGVWRRRGLRPRYTGVPPEDVVQLNDIPVTSPRRTALDLARWSRAEGRALAMLDLSLRHGLLDPTEFADYLRPMKGLHGLRRVRTVVGEMCGQAESVPESELRWTWLCLDLPRPVPNVAVYDRAGRFVGRIDLLDPESGLGAEYQGYWHHLDGAAEHDETRFAKFAAMNLTIVPIWKADVADGSVPSLLAGGHRKAEARDRRLDTWTIGPAQGHGPRSPRSPAPPVSGHPRLPGGSP